jgi:glucose-1-phosphate thymidylyltransferase
MYLDQDALKVEVMGRGMTWLDTGTHESLIEASNFIETIEKRQGLKICSPEETAYRMGFIKAQDVLKLAEPLAKTAYGQYLLELFDEPTFG